MKLNLLFIVMDLLTILAYPIVFLHGKLRRLSKPKEDRALALVPVPVTRVDSRIENYQYESR
ncbi:MAG: hypothetical protein HY865_01985 [Chloroflexi bacterium]|nr:hypothetical protein [Chloroflexota bacterium]